MLCEPDEDYSSDEDDDYVPSGEASEGESEGDDEEEEEEGQEGGEVKGQRRTKVKKGSKRKGQKVQEAKRNRTGGICLQEDEAAPEQTQEKDAKESASVFEEEERRAVEMKKEEKDKQKADDLWSSFLKDIGGKPKPKPQSSAGSLGPLGALSKQVSPGTNAKEAKPEKVDETNAVSKKTVTVTKVFDFAGEAVKVTEEVAADSKEAKKFLQPPKSAEGSVSADGSGTNTASPIPAAGVKRPGGGLSSVLGLINKKPKMSVLEKSRLDWKNFTKTEGIEDDLKLYNKGKEGFIEKQKFLAQVDQRQYEKERDLRMGLAKR